MRSILIRILLCSAVVLSARAAFALEGFSDTSLIDIDQNQALVQSLQANLSLERPASPFVYKLASVHFIVGSNGQTFNIPENNFTDPTGDYCKRYGFTVTSCPSGLFNQACPYNDKIYDKCCDAAYTYTAATCSAPKQLSSDTCGGKYKCFCSTSAYPYASCNSPQIKGAACTDSSGTRYKTCTCPSSVSAPYGCESYYGAPCGSVCQKAYTDNCRNRTAVQTPYGCQAYFSDCPSKCQTAYKDNCRNRNAVSVPYGCQQYYGDCQSKCEIAYSDNCRNRTAVATPYGCKAAFSDCSSKCQTAYADNCHNRTAVSVPANASCSAKFADCGSKCSAWSCNAGYTASGSTCKLNQAPLPILYGDGTVTKEILSGKTPIGVVFDETNKLALALTDVTKDGSSGTETMSWSSSSCNVLGLMSCINSDKLSNCGVNGRVNTTAILNSGCGMTYAANAANNYQPSGCSADFCKKNQWFLPSIRDLQNIYNMKNQVETVLTQINSLGFTSAVFDRGLYHWSSTQYDVEKAWDIYMMLNGKVYPGLKNGVCLVRPVIYYGEPKVTYGPPCEVGDVYYSDRTCIAAEHHTTDKTPVGIVAWLNDSNKNSGMLVAIKTTQLQWTTENTSLDISCLTNYTTDTAAKTDMNGKKNTQCLMTYKSSYKFPAAEFCHTYKPANSGFGADGWYLPALGEILKLKTNNNINNDFKVAKAGEIVGRQLNYLWTTNISGHSAHSSTEIYQRTSSLITCGAWYSETQGTGDRVNWGRKERTNFVLCFHEF